MAQSRSAKAMILASGQGLTTFVTLAIAAVLARLLEDKADYATYRQTVLAYMFAAPFVMLGFQQALFYFLPTEKERPRGVLVENLLLLATGGLLLSLFLLAGGNKLLARRFSNPGIAETLLILAPYPLLMLPAAALPACLLARGRAVEVAVFNVSSRLAMLLAVVIPCLIWPTPVTAVAGLVAVAFLTTAGALVLMFRACRPQSSESGSGWPTWAGLRRQIVYSVPLGLAMLAGSVTRGLDKVMVALLCAPELFAVYVNGAMEVPLIAIVTGSVTSVLIVDYARLYREARIAELVGLIHRAMIKCAVILIPTMVFLLCMAPEVMRLLFGRQYGDPAGEFGESYTPFRVYLLMLPMRTLTFSAILMATGNSRHVLIESVLGLSTKAIVAWYAIQAYGPIGGAATSVLVTYFVSLPYLLIVLRLVLGCPLRRLFPWRDLFKLAVAAGTPGLAVAWLKSLLSMPDIASLAITGVVYASAVVALLGWFKLVDASKPYAVFRERYARWSK